MTRLNELKDALDALWSAIQACTQARPRAELRERYRALRLDYLRQLALVGKEG